MIAAVALLGLRALHIGVPLFFPDTRPGPFAVGRLEDVRRRAGFAPLVPAYRPITLGEQPVSLTVTLQPEPSAVIAWRGEQYLSLTERRGGATPPRPAIAEPLPDVPDSAWWREGERFRMVLKRGELWIEIDTDLPFRDLKRIADTLTPY